MARIAIIGAGVVGATAALVLARAGHPVDLYSDRTAEQLRDDVPATGPDLAARLADPQTPVWVLTDAHGLVRSVVPRETILAAVDATRRP
mgnify:CR=1 FL=1